jgi:hypothetical protein
MIGSALVLVIPALATAASVELKAARDKPFCAQILELFQKNMGSGARLDVAAEPFSQINWEPAVIAGPAPRIRHCSSLGKTSLDLDNDGSKDLVVKATFCMKGAPSDSLYVFPADSRVLEEAAWQDMAPLLATSNKFERTGGSYLLATIPMPSEPDQGPPALHTVFAAHPFLVGGKAYVALTDDRGPWMVVARYLGGEQFEDQCYLKSSGTS